MAEEVLPETDELLWKSTTFSIKVHSTTQKNLLEDEHTDNEIGT